MTDATALDAALDRLEDARAERARYHRMLALCAGGVAVGFAAWVVCAVMIAMGVNGGAVAMVAVPFGVLIVACGAGFIVRVATANGYDSYHPEQRLRDAERAYRAAVTAEGHDR